MKITLIALALTTLVISGCGNNQPRKVNNDSAGTSYDKINQNPITEKYWKLVTLQGQRVTMAENQEREIYFMLKISQNQVKGFAGCNTFKGSYALEKGNRIRFSPLATTRKACPDVDVDEVEFLKVFELANNYTINADTLNLNVGRRAPLAVFEAVYF